MTTYVFDVDHTPDVSDGLVPLDAVVRLGSDSDAVMGLCGDWGVVTPTVPGGYEIFSFVGPIAIPRVYGNSDDVGVAAEAGWRFIREHEFAAGVR